MQWHTQADSINTNLKVKIDFTLPELSATKHFTWNCHMDDSYNIRNNIILGRDLLIALVLNLEFSDHVIETCDVNFNGYTSPMVDLGTYEFKD